MLSSLKIRNLAIVEDLYVEFHQGLNIITGETGAGKSIIMGALSLILGERASRSDLRADEQQCSIEAVFKLSDSSEAESLLEELGLPPCEDGQLILKRFINASGSGRNLINDSSCTLQAMERIGNILVDMHGPYEHQSLLNPAYQTDVLDSFGHLWKQRSLYEETYESLLTLRSDRKALDSDDETVAQQIDLYSFQIKELSDAKLSPGEETSVEEEHSALANASGIQELCSALTSLLTDSDESVFSGLVSAQQLLEELSRFLPSAGELKKESSQIASQINEISASIADLASKTEADPSRLQWLDDRMALLSRIKRKYGGSIENALTALESAKTKLEHLETRNERIAALEEKITEAEKLLLERAKKLTAERKKAARALSDEITSQLVGLGFNHGSFSVSIESAEPGPAGSDKIQFGFAPNAGEPSRSLRDIASSGEISRVMLAVKTVLADYDRVPVLVFDEIDANVGGEIGNAIGSRLSAVSDSHQIICITHLPQVAVFGAVHYVVDKDVSDGRTKTHICLVSGNERINEIARMLGGKNITSVVQKHAEEMIALASISPKKKK